MSETDTYPIYFKYTTYMSFSMENIPSADENEPLFQSIQEFIKTVYVVTYSKINDVKAVPAIYSFIYLLIR